MQAPGNLVRISNDVVVMDSAAHLLKLAVRRVGSKLGKTRVHIYHSWRAVVQGRDAPLDQYEHRIFGKNCPVKLFLVGNKSHVDVIEKQIGAPAMVLPYTSFLPEDVFLWRSKPILYDVVFSCMFREDQIIRKYAEALLNMARADRSIRILWIGGYDVPERWYMENAFNEFVGKRNWPADWLAPWSEAEFKKMWSRGAGIFPGMQEQEAVFERLSSTARRENLNIAFRSGLCRDQVAAILSSCGVSLVLSTADLWPRSITESLASGIPVVAVETLISGKQLISDGINGVLVPDRSPDVLLDAVRCARLLRGAEISRMFYAGWGLQNCTRRVVRFLWEAGVGWGEIVDWQRPFETNLKMAVRRTNRAFFDSGFRPGTGLSPGSAQQGRCGANQTNGA